MGHEFLLGDWCLTAFNCFNEAIIFLIKSIQNKPSKLGIMKWLADGCKTVSGRLDLIKNACADISSFFICPSLL
jgi:hypothetical protein